jgi:flagellar hook-basal body complex protein FliE
VSLIPPIAPIAVSGPLQAGNVTATARPSTDTLPVGAATPPAGGFAAQLDALSAAQAHADQLAVQAATGDLTAVQDYMVASTEAQLMTQLTVAVRDKAVEAFNDIMRMQV